MAGWIYSFFLLAQLLALSATLLLSFAFMELASAESISTGSNVSKRISSSGSPNIVFVLLDDVGINDLSFSALSKSSISTPHMDKLANEGLILDSYYAQSVCSPSRAALLTGKYSTNVGIPHVIFPQSLTCLPAGVQTLPEKLRDEYQYKTYAFGKWHLGHSAIECSPVGKGFDLYIGNLIHSDHYNHALYDEPFSINPFAYDHVFQEREEESESVYIKHFKEYTSTENTTSTTGGNESIERKHSTDVITENAIKYMTQHAQEKTDQPAFFYVSYQAAHAPLQDTTKYMMDERCRKKYSQPSRRAFCAMALHLDDAIETLQQSILQTLGRNTLLVVSSDNGGSVHFGGSNFPYRGSKGEPLEGGVKIPGFIYDFSKTYLPSHSKLGAHYPNLMHISDWYATLEGFVTHKGMHTLSDAQLLGRDSKDHSYAMRLAASGLLGAFQQELQAREDLVEFSNFFMGWEWSASSMKREERDLVPRTQLLLEYSLSNETLFGNSIKAFRNHRYKLVEGYLRGDCQYGRPDQGHAVHIVEHEHSTVLEDHPHLHKYPVEGKDDTLEEKRLEKEKTVPTTGYSIVQYLSRAIPRRSLINIFIQVFEWHMNLFEFIFGASRFDTWRLGLTHLLLEPVLWFAEYDVERRGASVFLFDLEKDPYETTNIAAQHPGIVRILQHQMHAVVKDRLVQQRVSTLLFLSFFLSLYLLTPI